MVTIALTPCPSGRSPAPTSCQPCSTFLCGPISVWLGGIWLSTSVAAADECAFWKKRKPQGVEAFTNDGILKCDRNCLTLTWPPLMQCLLPLAATCASPWMGTIHSARTPSTPPRSTTSSRTASQAGRAGLGYSWLTHASKSVGNTVRKHLTHRKLQYLQRMC